MVKQITHLKHPTFWKNDTSTGGAMVAAINDCPAEHIVVHTQNKRTGRTWGHMNSDNLLKALEKNNGIYEVLSKFPYKVYFDIDKKNTIDNPDDAPTFLNNIKQYIEDVLPNGDMAISGSVTDTKISYHIVLNNYIINSMDDLMTVKAIAIRLFDTVDASFDWKVYTKNRNMKAINQSKDDGRIQSIIENLDWKSHLITCFANSHPLPFPAKFSEPVFDTILQERAKVDFNIGSLPKFSLPTPKNIIIEELTPNDILALLPVKGANFAYKHKIARFCYTNEVTFEEYLSWLAKDGDTIIQTADGKRQWDKLSEFVPCTIQQILPILKFYYSQIDKDIHWRHFLNLWSDENTSSDCRVINTDYLCQNDYNTDSKFIVCHLGMGSGKTAQTIEYLRNISRFVWIGHRQSLHKGTHQRIVDDGIECVDYMNGNARTKPSLYEKARCLSICLPSLTHISDTKTFNVVVIDEIESVLSEFTNSLLNKNVINKKKILNTLIRLISSADKVILLDAFITDRTLAFIRAIQKRDGNCDTPTIIRQPMKVGPTIIVKNYKKVENDEEVDNYFKADAIKCAAVDEMCQVLISGKKIIIYYPYKKDMDALVKSIEIKSGKRGIFYNADVDDIVKNTLNNVNEVWSEYDFVMTNSVITCGVNYDRIGYDSAWLLLNMYSDPRQMIQVSARIRHLMSNTIYVVYLQNMTNSVVFEDDRRLMRCSIYDTVYDGIMVEQKAPKRKAFEYFCRKAGYKITVNAGELNSEICKEMTELFLKCKCKCAFEDIPNIYGESYVIEEFEEAVNNHEATMLQKLCLQKYYFLAKFKTTVIETEKHLSFLADVWDNKLAFFFDQLIGLHETPSSIFKDIQDENNWDYVIPPANFVKGRKQIKLSPALLDRIFNEFNFRSMTKLSYKNLIFKYIMNRVTGYYTIETEFDKSTKHTTCDINPLISTRLTNMIDLIDNGLKNSEIQSCFFDQEILI